MLLLQTHTLGPHFRSAQDLPDSLHQIPNNTLGFVAFTQIVLQAAPQEADLCGFTGVLARHWHVSLVVKIPELLKEAVVFDKGL